MGCKCKTIKPLVTLVLSDTCVWRLTIIFQNGSKPTFQQGLPVCLRREVYNPWCNCWNWEIIWVMAIFFFQPNLWNFGVSVFWLLLDCFFLFSNSQVFKISCIYCCSCAEINSRKSFWAICWWQIALEWIRSVFLHKDALEFFEKLFCFASSSAKKQLFMRHAIQTLSNGLRTA